jgi:multiple sugar transport system substrate-binding protein
VRSPASSTACLTPPQTWAQLQADAKALKARGVKIPYALPLGREEAQAETMMWMLSGGSGYTDDVGTYSLDSPQNVKTFEWLKDDLVGQGLTGPTPPAKLDRAQAFAAFTRGDVGMLNGHPTLMQMAAKKGVRFGMVPMPGIHGRAPSTMGVADWMMAFRQNGHKDQVGKFLDFVYSEKNVLDFSREYDLLPVTNSASDTMADDKRDQKLSKFLGELPNSQLYPVGKTSWAQVSAGIKREIGSAVGPNGNPGATLGRLQRSADAAENAE